MTLWLEIFKELVKGNQARAIEILRVDLPLSLRSFSRTPSDGAVYQGVLPDKVRYFISGLPTGEREVLESRQEDFVDYVLDRVTNQIERSFNLVRFCLECPDLEIEEIARQFPDWEGYKRSEETKIAYVAGILQSLVREKIKLPATLEATAEKIETSFQYEFNEGGLVWKWDYNQSWRDFQRKQQIGGKYSCVNESGEAENPQVSSEGYDYRLVAMSEVVESLAGTENQFSILALKELGETLTPEIEDCLEEMHQRKSKLGYRPIAHHRVFWDLLDTYAQIPLDLTTAEQECPTDNALAEYLSRNYPDVLKPNRQNVNERRANLHRECERKIRARVVEWALSGEGDL